MKLIPNAWDVTLHAYSQRAQALALALVGSYQMMPDKFQAAVPPSIVMLIACLLLVLGMVGRVIEQPELRVETEKADEA